MQPASLSEWCFLEVPLRKHTQALKEVRGRECLKEIRLPKLPSCSLISPPNWKRRPQAGVEDKAWDVLAGFLLLHHRSPQSQQLKIPLGVLFLQNQPVSQATIPSCRSNLVGLDLCSEYHKTEVRVSARPGEIHSKLTWVGRTQFPGARGAEAHAPLLATSQGRSPFSLQASSGVLNP